MSDLRYAAKFINEAAIGQDLAVLEHTQKGQEARDNFCDRLLDHVESNSLNPRRMGMEVTKSEWYADCLVFPGYDDPVVGSVNVVYRIHGKVITICMIQKAAKKGS